MNFEKEISNIRRDYYNLFGFDTSGIKYILTNDIVREYSALNPRHVASEPGIVETLDKYNGLMVCPNEASDSFVVLINEAKLLEYYRSGNYTWIGTIAHETTHVRDYIEYASILETRDYESLQRIDEHWPFQLWSEFHARSVGYFFVRQNSFENMFDELLIDDIVDRELPAQLELLMQSFQSADNEYLQAYYISQFLGRLYALQNIYPLFFTDEWIYDYPLLSENEWIADWYRFWRKNEKLKKVYEHSEEMKDILRRFFSGI